MYNSIIHQLSIVFYVHNPKSSLSSPFTPPLYPLVTIILLSVSMSFCLFVLLISLLLSILYTAYERNHMALFCLTDLAYHDILRVHSCCPRWQCFFISDGWVVFHSIWTTSFLSNHLSRVTSVVSMAWVPWIRLQWT